MIYLSLQTSASSASDTAGFFMRTPAGGRSLSFLYTGYGIKFLSKKKAGWFYITRLPHGPSDFRMPGCYLNAIFQDTLTTLGFLLVFTAGQ
jgi:hypothetical protein